MNNMKADMNEQEKEIMEYLEYNYCGAKMMNNESCEIRIARAIVAFKADPEVSPFVIFTEKFITEEVINDGEKI